MITRQLIESYEDLEFHSTDDEGIDNYKNEATGHILGYRASTNGLCALEMEGDWVRLDLSDIHTEEEFELAMKLIEWKKNEDIAKEQTEGKASPEYAIDDTNGNIHNKQISQ